MSPLIVVNCANGAINSRQVFGVHAARCYLPLSVLLGSPLIEKSDTTGRAGVSDPLRASDVIYNTTSFFGAATRRGRCIRW